MFVWRFFPEMQRFPSDLARKDAWRKAYSDNPGTIWARFAVGIPIICLLLALILLLGIRNWSPRVQFLAVVLNIAITSIIAFWLMRGQITKLLRQELNTCGIATCIKCGYDLRACTENRCSECGAAFHLKKSVPKVEKSGR